MNVEANEDALMARLRTENTDYQKWEREHRDLENTLMTFETHRYLTPEQEVERKRLQKLKLAAKDRMADIIRRTMVGLA
jgi:hypothetical protein